MGSLGRCTRCSEESIMLRSIRQGGDVCLNEACDYSECADRAGHFTKAWQ